jgi:hypothetical protein
VGVQGVELAGEEEAEDDDDDNDDESFGFALLERLNAR